ncbi:hypothetical protein [Facklamia hominis]|uniref:hypothetical protein n=1 Tax=Facklamia hominis TaxID=178214 RepID=UPI000C7DB5A7|nr:hypothetical protein [Facklamia hominis]PKY93156.1 hypothetical protein CYJ56_04425 [Facklamia hominis]
MKNMQDGSLVLNGNPLSTIVHELGHWYQCQTIKQKYLELIHEGIMVKETQISRKMVEKLVDNGNWIMKKTTYVPDYLNLVIGFIATGGR